MSAKKEKLLEHLFQFVSENKQQQFSANVQKRTRHLTVVLEDIYQPQNASAVLRTCDCLGIQDVHIIENRNEYTLNPDVALGASKWLNMYKYNEEKNNTSACVENLKKQGYQIIATTPHKNDFCISELNITKKTALVFGTEMHGISDTVMEQADGFVKIPMYGFTESYNISVSAAICLFTLTEKVRKEIKNWSLTKEEQQDLLIQWAKQVVKKGDSMEQEFLSQ